MAYKGLYAERMRSLKYLLMIAVFCAQAISFAWADDAATELPQSDDAVAAETTTQSNSRVAELYEILKQAGWGDDDDNTERMEIFSRVEQLATASDENTQALRDNAQAMRDKEQSAENKLLGAAGIGSVGIGTQMAASALAEQNADDAAQRDMAAYLATFKCDYGTGMNITGGQTDVELPGGNDLFTLVNEYKTLAADLKVRKESLGLAPGIESETIIDAAETGLYDNAAIGKTGGAYASLARALSDETSDDAKQIAEQKSETAKKLKTGAITAGVGAVTTIAADLAINSKNKNKSDDLLAQRDQIESDTTDMIKRVIDECNADIAKNRELAQKIKSENPNWASDETLNAYVTASDAAETLQSDADIIKIKDSALCR